MPPPNWRTPPSKPCGYYGSKQRKRLPTTLACECRVTGATSRADDESTHSEETIGPSSRVRRHTDANTQMSAPRSPYITRSTQSVQQSTRGACTRVGNVIDDKRTCSTATRPPRSRGITRSIMGHCVDAYGNSVAISWLRVRGRSGLRRPVQVAAVRWHEAALVPPATRAGATGRAVSVQRSPAS